MIKKICNLYIKTSNQLYLIYSLFIVILTFIEYQNIIKSEHHFV